MMAFLDIKLLSISLFQGEYMFWLPLVLIAVFSGVSSLFVKLVADGLPKNKALFVQYLFCSLFIFVFWLFSDKTFMSLKQFLLIGGIFGILNYSATYSQWTAYKINMSKTSLLLPWISLLTIALFFFFLEEYKQLNPLVIVGAFLQLVALCLFSIGRHKGEKKKGSFKVWLFFTVLVIVINVLINFEMKILSFDVSTLEFLLPWYVGTFFFSALALPFGREKIEPLKKRLFVLVPLNSMLAMAGLFCLYWAFQLSSGTVVVAFSALASTFIPAAIGWFVFAEGKRASKLEIAGLVCGVISAIFILVP